MKSGDMWTCPACKAIVQCDEWGIRHIGAGHAVNFRKEQVQRDYNAVQLSFQNKTHYQKKLPDENGQGSLF